MTNDVTSDPTSDPTSDVTGDPAAAAARLAELEPACDRDEALAFFDTLPAVRAETLRGQWRGRELATGHPMDGLLEASGWYGKRFDSADEVHPLLFTAPGGRIVSADPRRIPFGMLDSIPEQVVSRGRAVMGVALPLLVTKKPRARLRNVEYRGVVTAGMSYDHLPIIDLFRRVDDTTLLGCMDLRAAPPYFFVLQRD
ncbi:DUF4334 domain-containing protein [Nocardioides sp. zg-536]|uniref:DUF4334 domain-containing protein n=1 Tax=Nocardioides faecalis TaxID=2803858 RepID=A0A939BUE9_9ACTN|nr:DUF4334 domain-containing protein [Nocardioides faecalis]MBM9461604.1 DUF4334 domain-containing protein [Nocardioides faecalis]QVI57763.1 DUF4334 domain-containing protein [Nocardioides faecalis]